MRSDYGTEPVALIGEITLLVVIAPELILVELIIDDRLVHIRYIEEYARIIGYEDPAPFQQIMNVIILPAGKDDPVGRRGEVPQLVLKLGVGIEYEPEIEPVKKLGRLRYDELTHGADDASPAENAVIAEIEALISDLEKLKNRGADESASRVCRRCRFCGAVISDDAVYCSKCGGKQE